MSLTERLRAVGHRAFGGGSTSLLGRLVVGNLVVAGLLIALGFVALQSSHQAYMDKARDATESLATSLRQGIGAEIRRVDMALLTVRSAQAHHAGDAAGTQTLLDEQLALLPWADSLRMTDAQGVVRLGRGVVSGTPVRLNDREFFRQAMVSSSDELIISEPLEARISKQWVIVLARRLSRPDGSFAGVVYANVSAQAFARRFAEIDVGQSGAITLRSATRQLIARHAPGVSAEFTPGSSQVSKELEAALKNSPRSGVFVSATMMDGIERVSAYRKVDEYPLIVLVGLATGE